MQYWWLVSKRREGAVKHTHTQANAHLLCSVTSSVLLSAEQMQRPARQLDACDDFLWALYGASSWLHTGTGDGNKTCEQEHQNLLSRFTRVRMLLMCSLCVCVCVCWEAMSHFPWTYHVSREIKRAEKKELPKTGSSATTPLTSKYKARKEISVNECNSTLSLL